MSSPAFSQSSVALPPIPPKRYFVIGEVARLCAVKTHVLRYWEQEFTQLRPLKRKGNRRYYQHHEVLMVRYIRALLYEQGLTIQGARNVLGRGLGMDTQEGVEGEVLSLLSPPGGEGASEGVDTQQTPCAPWWVSQEIMAIQRILRG